MTAIAFYHLTRTTADQALPALLGRTLAAGQRAVIRCATPERVAALDEALWLDPGWLPHGTTQPQYQPIWLTTVDEQPNGGRYLFLLDAVESTIMAAFDRVFDLFDGNSDPALTAAQQRYAAAKAAGHTLSYLQQGPEGWQTK